MNAWSAVVDAAFDIFDRVTLDPAPVSRDDGGVGLPEIVRSSIEDPIGDVALSQRLQTARRITLVVSDGPGAASESTLRVLLEHLDAYARPDAEVTALVATDWRAPLGPDKLATLPQVRTLMQHQVPIVVHDRHDARAVGVVTVDGHPVPVALNPLVLDTDLVLVSERIELAWGAGLSGGYKQLARGVAGSATLAALDRLADALPDRDRTRIDRAHPLHEAWARVAAATAPAFVLFETVTASSRAFVSGEPSMALAVLAERPGTPWYVDAEPFDGVVLHVECGPAETCIDAFARAMVLLEHGRAPLASGAPVLVVVDAERGWSDDAAHRAFASSLRGIPNASDAYGDGVVAVGTLARRWSAAVRRHPVHAVVPSDVPDLGESVQRHRNPRDGCEGLALHMRALAGCSGAQAGVLRDIAVRLPVVPSRNVSRSRRSSG